MRPVLLLFLLGIGIPLNAYAYLDPASGNAIVAFFLAIFGSAIFMVKSLFYKITARAVPRAGHRDTGLDDTPVVFSEGKIYWATFRPVIEQFIREEQHFRYITLDVHDPALEIDSAYMHSTRVSRNTLGFTKIARVIAPAMLSTTPNIGSEGYPLRRPAGVRKLAHVFHAMVDLSCYRKGSLDHYDVVFMAGAHEEAPIRLVEKARNTPEKELVVAGLPCLDDLYRQKNETALDGNNADSPQKTILVAPSWGAKGCFSEYGTAFLGTLSNAGFRIIIRLHPHSRIFEPEAVENWKRDVAPLANVTWDEDLSGNRAMSQADLLISDASSIRFDFAFLYRKPVISLEISRQSRSIFESDYIGETWADSVATEIGAVVGPNNIASIDTVAAEVIASFTPGVLENLCDRYVANFGNSSAVIVDYLCRESARPAPQAEEIPQSSHAHSQDINGRQGATRPPEAG